MQHDFDVIVIGVGAMGASACHHLARRGARVLGIEQFDIPNAMGSSHGHSRIIRQAYFEHPDYVPLLIRAYELWEELETLSETKVTHMNGGLYIGPADCELVAHSRLAAERHRLDHEMLDRTQLHARFPQFAVPPDFVALHEPRAGFLIPEKAIGATARVAIRSGAVLHQRETVQDWQTDSTGVRVRTDRAEYRANELVFCAGAWTGKLLKDLGIPLVVTRQPMLWFSPNDPSLLALDRMPIWAMYRAAGGIYYGFPIHEEAPGLKAAIHFPGESVDPNTVSRAPRLEDAAEISQIIARHLPAAQGPIVEQRVCLYTSSPDSHFIIDRHPKHPRVTLACGFSGHGFKFASVVGEILADLAMKGSTELAVGFLGLSRFGNPQS